MAGRGTVSSSRTATDGPRGDSLWQGAVAVDGPGGPILGGTSYCMTDH